MARASPFQDFFLRMVNPLRPLGSSGNGEFFFSTTVEKQDETPRTVLMNLSPQLFQRREEDNLNNSCHLANAYGSPLQRTGSQGLGAGGTVCLIRLSLRVAIGPAQAAGMSRFMVLPSCVHLAPGHISVMWTLPSSQYPGRQ